MTEKKTVRLHIMLSPSELKAIDAWRFKHKIASRAEAVRQLIASALIRLKQGDRGERQ